MSGGTSASFVYDGDGQRVKGTVAGVTTVYVGNTYEWTGSTSTAMKYYYAGGQRVAMRIGSSTLRYLLGDHLGSTALTLDSSGGFVAEVRYKAWGGTRYTSGTTPTTYRFTGQRQESGLGGTEGGYATGLYYYGAPWYDPLLARFVSADTIVPEPGNPQSLNRYSFRVPGGRVYDGRFTSAPNHFVEIKTSTHGVVRMNPAIASQIALDANMSPKPMWLFVDARPGSGVINALRAEGLLWHELHR